MVLFGGEVAPSQRSGLLLLLSLFLLLAIWIPGGSCSSGVDSSYEVTQYGYEAPGSIQRMIQPAIGSIGRRWLLEKSKSSKETITLSHEAIAGIVVGLFFAIALVVLAVYVCRTRKYVAQRQKASLARRRAAELGGAGVDLEVGGADGYSEEGSRSFMPTPQKPLFPSSTGR